MTLKQLRNGGAEFVRDCLQVFRLTFVFVCGRTRDHLQVTDASEFGQDLILNTVGAALTNRLPPTINNLPFTNHSSFARVVEWQTRTFEGRMPKGMRVQVPPRAYQLELCALWRFR